MFPTLGLFQSLPCPDKPSCERPNCLFSHSPDVKQVPTTPIPVGAPKASSSKPVAGPSQPSPSSSKVGPRPSSATVVPAKRPGQLTSNGGVVEPPRKLLKVGPSKSAIQPSPSVGPVRTIVSCSCTLTSLSTFHRMVHPFYACLRHSPKYPYQFDRYVIRPSVHE